MIFLLTREDLALVTENEKEKREKEKLEKEREGKEPGQKTEKRRVRPEKHDDQIIAPNGFGLVDPRQV
jgi:hypothetical protein